MKKLILALFMVCATASIGHTEGAWILWEKSVFSENNSQTPQTTSWKIIDSFPLYENCQNSREINWEDRKNSSNGAKEENKNITVMVRPFEVIIYWGHSTDKDFRHLLTEYLCLPDTVNPKLGKE